MILALEYKYTGFIPDSLKKTITTTTTTTKNEKAAIYVDTLRNDKDVIEI